MSVKKIKIHYAISVKEGSFISFCRPGWDYDKNVNLAFSENETEVSCAACLRCLEKLGYERVHKRTAELLERISE